MMKAVLSNADHPEYGVATIPLPVPRNQYDHCVALLEALEIGDASEADCRVDSLDSAWPVLNRLVSTKVNLDELDYLAKRLDSFTVGEFSQFQAMVEKLHLTSMKDLINLTFCCQQATVITDFSDLDAVGRQHYMTLEGGCASEEELEQVDGRAAALKLILNKHGTITPYGVVYDNGMELEKFYKEGGPFPDYLDREFVILLEASYGEGQSTLLVLPDSPERLERLLCRTGIRDSPHFWIVDSTLPGEVISSIPAERLSINGLNRLCQAVERIAPEDLKTLVQLLADKDHPSQGPSLGGLSM